MRAFIESVVRDAAGAAGIETVMLKAASSNITMPKPRVEIEFLQDTFISTGRVIGKRKMNGTEVRVHERYEVDSPVMLHLTDNDDSRVQQLSAGLVLAFPKGVADANNNWVRIKASSAEWRVKNAPVVGIKRIEPLIERLRLIRVSFTWRLTFEQAVPYITDINFIVKENNNG